MIKKRIFKLKDGRVLQGCGPTIRNDDNTFYYTTFGNFFIDLKETGDKQVFQNGAYIEALGEEVLWGTNFLVCRCYYKTGAAYSNDVFYVIKSYPDAPELKPINSLCLVGCYGVAENDFLLNRTGYSDGYIIGYNNSILANNPQPLNANSIFGQPFSSHFYKASFTKTSGAYGDLWKLLMEDQPEEWEYTGENTGEKSEEGGQNGSFDDSSDNINIPGLPSIGASNCGLVNMYELTVAQLRSFSDFLWSDITEVSENLKKLFSDPMDSIISLSLTPINPSTTTSAEIKIGNILTGVTGQIVTNQYLSIDCGEIEIKPYWDNFFVYSPYTKLSIYLPFIGTQVLNIDDFMNRKIGVKYNIDLLSGSCACFVSADSTVLYQYSGNVISQIPISGKNSLELYKAVISGIVNTGLAIGTGGASIGAQSIATLASSGMNVMNGKEIIQRGGQITGTNSLLSVKYPFITIIRANQSLPQKFNSLKGYPSNITIKLGDLSGYTEIEYIHLDGINALDSEKEEIERLLKEGVIF